MISINYFAHDRPIHYWQVTSYYFNKIKENNKKKIKINILSTNNNNLGKYIDGIELEEVNYPNKNNYLDKVNYSLNTNSKYSIKIDEDCFINNHIWDYIIENIEFLSNDDNYLISPLLSNNVPLTDFFIDSFVENPEQYYNYFENQRMPNGLWGVDYSSIQYEKWDCENFYEQVSKINSPLKGIHPIRICSDAQISLNQYILNNFDRINQKYEYEIQEFNRPYFTINTFAIKTDDWKRALELQSYDNFDEVQINNYGKQFNKKFFYVKNSFSIHPLYNTMYGNKNIWNIGIENGQKYEYNFVKTILEKLK